MISIFDDVTAGFFVSPLGGVTVVVQFWDSKTWVRVVLNDDDHQSLIATLDAIWPNWSDVDQSLARSE